MSWKNGELWIRKKMRTAHGMMAEKIKRHPEGPVNRYSRLQGTQMKTPAAAVHPATGTDIMIWAR